MDSSNRFQAVIHRFCKQTILCKTFVSHTFTISHFHVAKKSDSFWAISSASVHAVRDGAETTTCFPSKKTKQNTNNGKQKSSHQTTTSFVKSFLPSRDYSSVAMIITIRSPN